MLKMLKKYLLIFFVMHMVYVPPSLPTFAQGGRECVIDQKQPFFLDVLFSPKRIFRLEVYNNTGQNIDLFVNGKQSVTLGAGESMTYKLRIYSGYYMCLTVGARMNGYYSRVQDFTVGRYNDDCPRPIIFTHYDFPSEASRQKEQVAPVGVVTFANQSTGSVEVFREGVLLGSVSVGEVKAFQATSGAFLLRSLQGKFVEKHTREGTIVIIQDSDFK